MSTPRYVCLSDLHLGAGYSTLTATDARGEPDPARPSPTLTALGLALRQLLPALGNGPPPTLVLLGDVLDMGLSPMGSVAAAFDCFVQAVMLDGDRPLFAPRVLCVPGNHDHHLWRIAQDQHFQDSLREGRIESDLIAHTALFQDPAASGIPSPMLTGLIHRHPALSETRVEIAYPNLGLVDAERRRCVVLHHGHYVDPMYRLVSALDAQAPGLHGRGPATMAQLEARNGAWVDFLWSDLGSAGLTGTAATTLYEVMRDGGASQRFAQRLSALLVARLGTRFGLSGSMPMVQGITLDQLLLGLLDATLGRGAESQRDSYLALMTAGDVADLRWFLSGPVKLELERAGLEPSGLDLAFVFGHTHKPFQDELPVAGFDRPVRVFNTGGWVMDQPTMTSTQGAAAVFIDEALNLASLRLFNDPVNGRMAPVQAQGVGGFGDRDNPMLAALAAGIERTAPAWQAFSRSAQTATEAHATRLLDKFFHVPGRTPATAP
ncbi:metallophosphoesterase [Variovorax sp. J31P207]|uniref:metallophosphoesterase n=1 Tax=Variovorax sp. J31P207 TaxID=3053510 RepID=UPI00257569F8|nr:metallophosphoesterase [Variovorax sp. J31P207]MDM0069832.1 metallophosphoesterase [Variovorax sp. J31P207]